jgi:acetyl esterase/lipase
MRARFSLLAVLCLLAIWAGARADEPKAAIKTGGSYEVETIKDVAYYEGKDADPVKHKLDLYLPKGKKDFPVLFFVHGGGWRNGDKKSFGKIGSVFAQNGIGAVFISYRLSPGVVHPAHVQDVAKAFAWTVNNIGKHGGKADQIIISGHSAGGHLVALLATDETYLKAEKLSRENIKGVIPVSGVFSIRHNERNEPVFGKDEEVAKNASPLLHVEGKLPPFLILYAEKDLGDLGKQAVQMNEALQKAKCESECRMMKDRDHGTIMRNVANEDDPATQAMLEFFAKHTDLRLKAKEAK